MESGINAGKDGSKYGSKNATADVYSFPQYPGEDCLAHAATQFIEAAEARLATRSLLSVAQGDEPPSVKCIIDVDLSELPELPPEHRDYHRRMDTRSKIKAQNRANDQKRFQLTMEAWTELYTQGVHGNHCTAHEP